MEVQWNSPFIQIIFAVLLAILPITISEIPVMWKCLLWLFAWAIMVRLGYAFIPGVGKLPIVVKISLLVGLSALLLAGTYGRIYTLWRKEKAAATSGVLRVHGATPNAQGRIFQIGRVGTTFDWQGPENQSPITFLDAAKFNLSVKNGELRVSMEVVDGQGKLVAKITDNRWEVSPDHFISWDKNYTDDTLEVLDGRQTVVLQIRLLADKVQIQGEWHDAFGNGTRIEEAPGGAAQIFKLVGQNNYPEQRIKPIMKYPSSEHWAEFE